MQANVSGRVGSKVRAFCTTVLQNWQGVHYAHKYQEDNNIGCYNDSVQCTIALLCIGMCMCVPI